MCHNPPSQSMASPLSNPKPLNPHASPFLKTEQNSNSNSSALKTERILALEPFLPHKISTIQSLPQPPPVVQPVPLMSQGFFCYTDYIYQQPTPVWAYPTVPTVLYNTHKQPLPSSSITIYSMPVEKEQVRYNAATQPLVGNSGVYPKYENRNGSDLKQKRIKSLLKFGVLGGRERRENRNDKRQIAPRIRSQRREKSNSCGEGIWVPKNLKSDKNSEYTGIKNKIVIKKKDDFEGALASVSTTDEQINLQGKTSLMIRNIPNQFERHDLLQILDNHCLEENRKAKLQSDPFKSEYDFLYLPMDFRNRANYGYAFVNFTNSVGASRFAKAFHRFEWEVSVNKKTCEICFALIQGKDGLKNNFKNSIFPCHTTEYLPVVLEPPRDGYIHSKPNIIGKRGGSGNGGGVPARIPISRKS